MSAGNDYWPAKVETMRKIEAELRAENERLRTTIKHMCNELCSPGDCQHPDCPRAASRESRDD